MTIEEFNKQKWTAGMRVFYKDDTPGSRTTLITDIVSVDFEKNKIGVELPGMKIESVDDLIWLPCDKCEVEK